MQLGNKVIKATLEFGSMAALGLPAKRFTSKGLDRTAENRTYENQPT